MEDEKLKEQLEIELKSFGYQRDLIIDMYLTEIIEKSADQILNLIKQAGWIDPATPIMPEYGTPKAEEILAQWAEANGYLPVEPAQLEVLSDEEFDAMGYDKDFDTKRTISQATIAHNEAMGQLYRRK